MDLFLNKVLKGKGNLLPKILKFIQVKNIGNVNVLIDSITTLPYNYVPMNFNLVKLLKNN